MGVNWDQRVVSSHFEVANLKNAPMTFSVQSDLSNRLLYLNLLKMNLKRTNKI